ncbi:hypothetical protein NXC14_PC00064 (plasmid) [Rhizobium sp. NXC14]|nr:hypothetical protein NXC14_PC00064 [Rhizobium sp. NXC14]
MELPSVTLALTTVYSHPSALAYKVATEPSVDNSSLRRGALHSAIDVSSCQTKGSVMRAFESENLILSQLADPGTGIASIVGDES